jgi:riboflavin transporter FmnP
MKDKKLNTLIKISLLSAIAFILMFFELPLPIFPSFLKIDLGDLPALIGGFALGPVAGVLIELLKNVLHIMFKGTSTALIGELSNFLVGSVLVATSATMYTKNKTRKNAIISLIIGSIVMSVAAGILNYCLFLPLYDKVLGFKIAAVVGMGSKINPRIINLFTLILWSIIPFNLLKGIVVSAASLAVYKAVSPILHKEEVYSGADKKELSKL